MKSRGVCRVHIRTRQHNLRANHARPDTFVTMLQHQWYCMDLAQSVQQDIIVH